MLKRFETHDDVVNVFRRSDVSVALDVAGKVVAVQAGVAAQSEAETFLLSSLEPVRLEVWLSEILIEKSMIFCSRKTTHPKFDCSTTFTPD